MKNKKIAVAVIAGVLTMSLGIGTALAASGAQLDGAADSKAKTAQQERTVPSREDLEKKAWSIGVDPTGLTDEQVQQAMKTAVLDEDSRSNEPMSHDELVQIAHEVNIDITGMTDAQIEAALKEYKLNQVAPGQNGSPSRKDLEKKAHEVGVDPTGLTNEQLGYAIKNTLTEEDGKESKVLSHDELVQIAQDVGIDITGMTDVQIEAALREAKMARAAAMGEPVKPVPTDGPAK